MLACECSSNISGAFRIRNMLKLHAKFFLKGKSSDMPNSAYAAVTHLDFAGVSLGVFYKFIHTVIGSFLGHD